MTDPKKKMTLNERIETDPELKAILEDLDDRMIERVKQGHREMLAREALETRRQEQAERRRRRLRRLTLGLLGR